MHNNVDINIYIHLDDKFVDQMFLKEFYILQTP